MKRVLMLLANGVEPLEMAAFTDVLGWANLLGDQPVELINAGLRPQIVTTFGLSLNPAHLLSELDLDSFDALALPGGFEPSGFYEEALSEPFLETIRHFVAAGKTVASVCVSACLRCAWALPGCWKARTPRRITRWVASAKTSWWKAVPTSSTAP